MKRILYPALFLTLILCACSPVASPPAGVPPSTTEPPLLFPTTPAPNPKLIVTVSTPHIDQPPDAAITSASPDTQQCGFQWARQDLPELSASFQQSIQALEPQAQARAYAFGENCVLADGSIARFLPMETDFEVTLQVDDLANDSTLGEWIVKVMQVIENIPPDQIVGPRPGRVSIFFEANGDQKVVNFYIDQYRALPSGLSHAEIYQALQTPQ